MCFPGSLAVFGASDCKAALAGSDSSPSGRVQCRCLWAWTFLAAAGRIGVLPSGKPCAGLLFISVRSFNSLILQNGEDPLCASPQPCTKAETGRTPRRSLASTLGSLLARPTSPEVPPPQLAESRRLPAFRLVHLPSCQLRAPGVEPPPQRALHRKVGTRQEPELPSPRESAAWRRGVWSRVWASGECCWGHRQGTCCPAQGTVTEGTGKTPELSANGDGSLQGRNAAGRGAAEHSPESGDTAGGTG